MLAARFFQLSLQAFTIHSLIQESNMQMKLKLPINRLNAKASVKQMLAASQLLLLAIPFSLMLNTQPVEAAPQDGSDPIATGCAGDARTIHTRRIVRRGIRQPVGIIELRYSPTCRTAWARVTSKDPCRSNGNNCAAGVIQRLQDNRQIQCNSRRGGRSCYTPQVRNAGTTARAYGVITVRGLAYEGLTPSF